MQNTTRPSPRQRSHSRLDPSEVLHSDGATAGARSTDSSAGGQTRRLHLHDAAGPSRRPDHHDKTTSRRTASQLRLTPAGASTARSSHAPAPPYHPAMQTRHRVTHRTPGQPAADTPRRRQIAQPHTGRPCASPSPSLHSTSASAWAAQARRLPLPLEPLMDTPQCRNSGPRHQSKFTLKKTFRAAHTPPLGDDHAEISRNITLDRRNMPQTRRDMPQC